MSTHAARTWMDSLLWQFELEAHGGCVAIREEFERVRADARDFIDARRPHHGEVLE